MTNWNRYSNIRKGIKLGSKKDINGGWRTLSDGEDYWEFKNGHFWWYKSANDLNDNYWYGTSKIMTGKSGLKSVGISESKIEEIIDQSNGKLNEKDFYSMVLTPTKIISNGVDRSSSNIPKNEEWKYVWIIVDHGSEGIEGQVLNVNSSDMAYYVKIKD